jgi:hypothetical protein
MACLFGALSNICSCLSLYGDCKNAAEKLLPCMRKKNHNHLNYREETYKITFLDHTIVKFEKIEENISQD